MNQRQVYRIRIVFHLCFLFVVLSAVASAQVQKVLVLKEIDDDNIIIVTEKGDKLLLKKWSLRFSPLVFEGKIFNASVSPMWVTIYFDDRSPIKWSIEQHLGRVDITPSQKQSSPGLTQGKVYYGVDSDHWIQKVIDSGKIILLEDGSIWEVSPLDVITSILWLPVSNIYVVESENSLYPYKLINTDDGESVEAKYLGQK